MEKIAQKICGVIFFGDLQNTSGHDPGYTARGVPAGTGSGQDGPRCAIQPQPFCDSVIM